MLMWGICWDVFVRLFCEVLLSLWGCDTLRLWRCFSCNLWFTGSRKNVTEDAARTATLNLSMSWSPEEQIRVMTLAKQYNAPVPTKILIDSAVSVKLSPSCSHDEVTLSSSWSIWGFWFFEGSLEVKLPTIWTNQKQSRAEAERRERLD